MVFIYLPKVMFFFIYVKFKSMLYYFERFMVHISLHFYIKRIGLERSATIQRYWSFGVIKILVLPKWIL